MKGSVAAVLLILFVAVGVYWVRYERSAPVTAGSKKTKAAEVNAKPSPAVSGAAESRAKEEVPTPLWEARSGETITWLQIQDLEHSVNMTFWNRQGVAWEMKFPVVDRADPEKIAELLRLFESTKKMREFAPEKSWEEYGLLRPVIKIGFETSRQSGRRYLLTGGRSPVGDFVFARWSDSELCFLLPAEFPGAFQLSVYSLRDKRLFRIEPAALDRIALFAPSGSYELVKSGPGFQWSWKQPSALLLKPLSAEQSTLVTEKLLALNVKDFADKPADNKENEAYDGGQLIAAGGELAETVMIGRESAVRDAFYVRRQQDKNGLLVARGPLSDFLTGIRAMASDAMTGLEPVTAPELPEEGLEEDLPHAEGKNQAA